MLAGVVAPAASGEDVPTIDATRRIAIVDQEWQHLRAVDLLVVLRRVHHFSHRFPYDRVGDVNADP
jgi:hypothetical protein